MKFGLDKHHAGQKFPIRPQFWDMGGHRELKKKCLLLLYTHGSWLISTLVKKCLMHNAKIV